MLIHRIYAIFAIILASALPVNASAQEVRYSISSGTGFFISMNGYVITNAHVVNGCDRAVVKSEEFKRTIVDVMATDKEKDLALLRTDKMPQFAAPLRDNISDLKVGDKALVMGYPGNHAITGDYALVDTDILDLAGPPGMPNTIQFNDSAQKGNSGGPLLDLSGNVIGVIMGKSETWRVDPVTKEKIDIRQSDVAISLDVLKNFLSSHGVYARDLVSAMDLSRDRIVDRAKYYIVNVQCAPDVSKESPELKDRILNDLATEPSSPDAYRTTPEAQDERPPEISPQIAPPPRSNTSQNNVVVYDKNRDTGTGQ